MKYVNIIDLREYDCYRNINARILYLDLACRMDVRTRNVAVSIRSMERDLGITYAAVRHALQLLIRCGLVTQLGAQSVAQSGAQSVAHLTTHLHIMSYNELQDTNNAGSSAEWSAEDNAVRSAESSAHYYYKNNNNINNSKPLTTAYARDFVDKFEETSLSEYCDVSVERARALKARYLELMEIKGKEWTDELDLRQHLLDWCKKNKKRAKDAAPMPQEPEQPQVDNRPHPSWLTADAWQWICNTCASGNAAPAVKDEYRNGCAELGIIPIYTL